MSELSERRQQSQLPTSKGDVWPPVQNLKMLSFQFNKTKKSKKSSQLQKLSCLYGKYTFFYASAFIRIKDHSLKC